MKRPALTRTRNLSSDYLQSMRLWTNFFAASGAEFDAIARLGKPDGADVLDIGCGNGRLSMHMAQKARTVNGIDLDAKQIEFAAGYARTNNVANLTFREMSATSLAFDNGSFDLVIMPWMLHMIKGNSGQDKLDALSEVKRVMRPGARLVVFAIWGDCDYDRIARHFVTRRDQEIEPISCYEEPLTKIFGSFKCEILPEDRSYSFIFPDCGVAVEAFTFAFSNWYDKKMNEKEVNHLRHLIHSYGWGPHIELKTKGAIYVCEKAE